MATDTAADAEALAASGDNSEVPDSTYTTDAVCPICTQTFTEPKLQLPGCSHTFCGACLAAWLDTSSPQAKCPVCRCAIEDPSGLLAGVGMRRQGRGQEPKSLTGSEMAQLILLAASPADATSSSSSSSSSSESGSSSCTQVIKPASGDAQDACPPPQPGESSQVVTASATALVGAWRLHSRHGQDITLSHQGQTASWTGTGKGIIVNSQYMKADELYEIQLDQAIHGHRGSDPAGGNSLPGDLAEQSITDGWDCNLVFHHDVYERGRVGPVAALGRKLIQLPVRTRFGVQLNTGRCLRLFCDGREVTSCTLSTSTSRSACFVVFELGIKFT